MFNLKVFDLFYDYCIKLAGKADDIRGKYPEFIVEIDEFVQNDPSGKNKYLEWMVKQLKTGFKKEDIIPTVKLFHKVIDKLDKKDINQYGTVKDLEDTLKDIDSKSVKEKRQESKEGGKKIYEDENYVIIRPDTKDACQIYGKNTKWCITMENSSYYEQYKGSNVVFYFLIRKKPKDDELDKVAFAYIRDNSNKNIGWEIYDAEDNVIHMNGVWLDEPYVRNGLNQNKIINLINSDVVTVPKSTLARLKSGDSVSEQELNELMNSEDEEARRKVAKQIDPKYLHKMINDEDMHVRKNVAERCPIDILPKFLEDDEPDFSVLYIVAERIDPKYLQQMYKKGGGAMFRDVIANRIDEKYLDDIMVSDISPSVIDTCMRRVNYDPEKLKLIRLNPDFNQTNFYNVRYTLAKKMPEKYLLDLYNTEEKYGRNESILDYLRSRLAYITNPANKTSSNKNRSKQDIRNDQPFKTNYDYGEGLYFGNMDKYKSVSDFIKKKRKKRKKILNAMLGGKVVK